MAYGREFGAVEANVHKIELGVLKTKGDHEKKFAALKKDRPEGLYASSGLVITANGKRIADFALRSRLPSVYEKREAVDAGGVIYYGADLADTHRRFQIDDEFKLRRLLQLEDRRAWPPSGFCPRNRLRAAKQIGLTIPQSMLYRADRVIK